MGNRVEHVVISPHEKQYSPPEEVVTIATGYDTDDTPLLFIDVCKYDETADSKTLKTTASVPCLRLNDVLRAIIACTPQVAAMFPPVPLLPERPSE